MSGERTIRVRINGVDYDKTVEPRRTLADFIRHDIGLTGTHISCEHGVCGACTIIFDGEPVRSCIMFAVQADGHELMTVEGLATGNELHPIQQAFWENQALQCGFCTAGFLMVVYRFLQENPDPTPTEVREALSGNICRCTGYHDIVRAVLDAAQRLRTARPAAAL